MLEVLAAHAAIAIDNAHLFAQVQQLAITDSLTGVNNRRYFFDAAQLEFLLTTRYKHHLSIIMLDLDNYKTINDVHGHIIGDLALKEFSKLLTDHIRESDILGRYGGDEFSILLPETDKNQVMEIAERLRGLISKTQIIIEQTRFFTTMSVGVSSTNIQVTDFSQLLLSADLALYDAKKGGVTEFVSENGQSRMRS
jgi:diguanylate cyclase (GGDEF)-like protein